MINVVGAKPKVVELSIFSRAEGVSADDLIRSFLRFEQDYLSEQRGVMFHCLAQNSKGLYGSLLFAQDLITLDEVTRSFPCSKVYPSLLGCIDRNTAYTQVHTILSERFLLPESFQYIEIGEFEPKDKDLSTRLEEVDFRQTANTVGYFLGRRNDGHFLEFVFGETLEHTHSQILDSEYGIGINTDHDETFDTSTGSFSFWSLIA